MTRQRDQFRLDLRISLWCSLGGLCVCLALASIVASIFSHIPCNIITIVHMKQTIVNVIYADPLHLLFVEGEKNRIPLSWLQKNICSAQEILAAGHLSVSANQTCLINTVNWFNSPHPHSETTIHAHADPPVVPALQWSKRFKMCFNHSLVFLFLKLRLCRNHKAKMLLRSSNDVQKMLSPASFQIFLLDTVVSSMIYSSPSSEKLTS